MMFIELSSYEKWCSWKAAILCQKNSYVLLQIAALIGESMIKWQVLGCHKQD